MDSLSCKNPIVKDKYEVSLHDAGDSLRHYEGRDRKGVDRLSKGSISCKVQCT